MTTVSVYVDVELDDIDTDDLIRELGRRKKKDAPSGVVPPLGSEAKHPLHEIFYAFKFGLGERAPELARAYVCDELGVVL